jgi:hypothetical protein
MFKILIAAMTGVSEERYDWLRAEIEALSSEKTSLEKTIRELQDATEVLRMKSLQVTNVVKQSFIVGTSLFLGEHEAGHSIYEVRVEGVGVPIRTKIQNR